MSDRLEPRRASAAGIVLALAVLALTGAAWSTAPALAAAGLAACVLCAASIRSSGRRRAAVRRAELGELRHHVRVDELTCLRNEQAYIEELDRELLRAERTGRPVCLVVLSLDPEPWNEQTSDVQRRVLAQAMIAAVRRVDLGFRIGSNEFAVVLPETRARGGLVAAGRVESALRARGAPPGQITVGIAEAGPGIDRRTLFRHAYVALLAASSDERSRIVVYSPELERGAPDRGGPDDAGVELPDEPSAHRAPPPSENPS